MFSYDARSKVLTLDGNKKINVAHEGMQAIFKLGQSDADTKVKIFNLYRTIPADVRKEYKTALESVFSRMTVNIWERGIEDEAIAYFIEHKAPAVATAYASIDKDNPKRGDFVALGKQAIETKGASKFVQEVRKENAQYKGKPARTIQDILTDIAKAKALLEKLQKEYDAATK